MNYKANIEKHLGRVDTMSKEEILMLIERISPHARDYVCDCFENVEVLYSTFSQQNKGVFLKVENEDCCIFYASFLNESNIEDVIKLIKNNLSEYISKMNSKELCFNVYGSNQKIIDTVRSLDFRSDMEGYHLEFANKELPQLIECNLIEKGFEDSMLEEFIELFDSAYYQLNIDNNWMVNSYALNAEQFNKKLNTLNKLKQVHSFWLKDEIVGAYIVYQNYITDLVVKPIFQNSGYGSYILASCLRDMRLNQSISNIRLRVSKSNIGAQKLYQKNGFTEIAYFAEHTY